VCGNGNDDCGFLRLLRKESEFGFGAFVHCSMLVNANIFRHNCTCLGRTNVDEIFLTNRSNIFIFILSIKITVRVYYSSIQVPFDNGIFFFEQFDEQFHSILEHF
jgi:hypothetical protein